MADPDTPSAADDLETAERKSLSVDERAHDRQAPDTVRAIELPGAPAANIPQQGLGGGPLDDRVVGPGVAALEVERKAQETPTRHG